MDKNNRRKDRRQASRNIEFPMIDGAGSYIGDDRRSGIDRRHFKSDEVVFNILSAVGEL